MGIMDRTYLVRFLKEEDFKSIVDLSDKIFGKGFLSEKELVEILNKSIKGNADRSFTISLNEGKGKGERLIGFRLSYWNSSHSKESICSRCGSNCECTATEMIIDFSTYKEDKHV